MEYSEDQVLECPMCGKMHRIRPVDNDPDNGQSLTDYLEVGRETLDNARKAASTATETVNKGIRYAGFGDSGIQKNSFASRWQSSTGNVGKGSVYSKLQSTGAKGGASNKGLVALGVAATVVAVSAGKLLWNKLQENKERAVQETKRQEEEKRWELNLCQDCWKVARENVMNSD